MTKTYDDLPVELRNHLASFSLSFLRDGLAIGVDRRAWTVTVASPDGQQINVTLERAAGGAEVCQKLFS